MREKIAVIGLGYVGLPLALAFGKRFPGTVGFDIDQEKVGSLRRGEDVISEGLEAEIKASTVHFTADANDLKGCTFFIVGVPTPIDQDKRPDLTALTRACETVGKCLTKGAVVVVESTVYPGVTEEVCAPLLEKASGMKRGVDFKMGYSPERINPGDHEHSLERVTKVVSGEDELTLERVGSVYAQVVKVGVHRAPSIKVAEAAKVIENTQRDLNIALMNELAMIFDLLGVKTRDVLAAAETKWNFIPFKPGLVGGHCIGVDPYYLTTKAEQIGYRPQVILAGRRINDGMGKYIAQRMVKLMVHAGIQIKGARVGVCGISFKENVVDIRNSRVPDIIAELKDFGVEVFVHDPIADPKEAYEEYGFELCNWDRLQALDGLILAVIHRQYLELGAEAFGKLLRSGGVFVDVKGAFRAEDFAKKAEYWSL